MGFELHDRPHECIAKERRRAWRKATPWSHYGDLHPSDAIFIVIAIVFALVAFSFNNRKSAAQKDIPAVTTERPAEHRATGRN